MNIKSILIIGNISEEKFTTEQLRSFELFRGSNKEIEIITFDELFEKIKIMINLFKS